MTLADEFDPPAESEESRYQFTPGGSFILDTDPTPQPLWGDGDQVLWADGESLVIGGPQGVGKTTLAQQLALGRAGFDEHAKLLGFPIIPGQRRVLYLAMDRPKQAARSFRRMVGDAWRTQLDERLSVWQGPPPYDLARHTSLLLKLSNDADADTAIVDSLKDAAIGLTDDEVGAGYNRARQTAIAAGVQVLELHHNRKVMSAAKTEKPKIDDVYGSVWLTSGAGSVLLLNGNPGDPIVSLHHLKQPASEVGPFKIIHDAETGQSQIWHELDLVVLAAQPGGVTALDAAKALFETDKPTAGEKEKARRRLETLRKKGLLLLLDSGDVNTKKPAIWGAK
jgi:AAA domain